MDVNRVSLLGHKDHGKSTLIGSLLMKTGSVSQERVNEARRVSKSLGRKFEPGFILDSFSEEREGGLTIDTTRAQILYRNKALELIDVPGHEELIKNMISGASNADLAVLMVSAKPGEGIKDQTLRHLFLARMLGINRIVVAVNKMDTAGYSEEKFDGIRNRISEFLKNIGFGEEEMGFVPVSAYTAENLVDRSRNMAWYRGRTLIEEIASEPKKHRHGAELRMSVQGTIARRGGELLIGRVASGELRQGDRIAVLPQGISCSVKSIFIKGRRARVAKEGGNAALALDRPVTNELRGSVVVHAGSVLKPKRSLDALIFAVEKPSGHAVLELNGASIPCTVRINEVIDTTTGRQSNRAIAPLNAARVTLRAEKEVMAEPFSKSRELGRFVLYDRGRFSGIGIVI